MIFSNRRRLFFCVVVFCVSLSVCVPVFFRGLRHYRERPLSGKLICSGQVNGPGEYVCGQFILGWTPGPDAAVKITHAGLPGKVLWETLPGRAFIGAAVGSETVTESRGLFRVSDNRLKCFPNQHVKAIDVGTGALTFRGELKSRNGHNSIAYTFKFSADSDHRLRFEFTTDNATVNRLFLTCGSGADERIFGFGEQFSHTNLKGKRFPVIVSEQGIGRGRQPLTLLVDTVAGAGGSWHTSYAPLPHYLTSNMRSFFLESTACSIFDLRADEYIQMTVFDAVMQGCILSGGTPAKLIGEYTAATGRQRPLPDWILDGAVIGIQGGTEKVRRVWADLRECNTPVAAFWLQDWVGQRETIVGKQLWWNWELDRNHYPDWEMLVNELAASGIRVMTYVNPFLVDPSGKKSFTNNLLNEARDGDYLVKNSLGEPYLVKNTDFDAAMVDLTNPEAFAWYKNVLREQMLATGVSGWMADFGEALPYDARLFSGEPARLIHNQYPVLWARLNRELVDEVEGGDELVFFTRSGYLGSPRYSTLFWLGDQMTTWDAHDGIKTAVTGLLSSGFSGFAFNHSDIGGYTAVKTPLYSVVRDKELLMRWAELNAFTVVFRTHEGINPDANHQIYSEEETRAHFSRCAKIYAAWADYRKKLVREAAETGLPVVRHPFIHYPGDRRLRDIRYEQFMVGEIFMVCPVLESAIEHVSCHLPVGKWTHLWTATQYNCPAEGTDISVSAPLGYPAVFYRNDAPEAAFFLERLSDYGVVSATFGGTRK